MRSLLFIFFLNFSSTYLASDIQNERAILLSFPRSGNTWVRYCIEYITKRPTGEYAYLFPINRTQLFMNNPINNNFDLGVDYEKPPIIKDHVYTKIQKSFEAKYLILVVRDYKECLPRHLGSYSETVQALQNPNCSYIQNLKVFHEWEISHKLLIYYEDLIQNPLLTYQKISSFFKEGNNNIKNFLEEIELHKANALFLYERDEQKSHTRGEFIHFHVNKQTLEQRKHLDELCEMANPEIFNLYLSHYKESK